MTASTPRRGGRRPGAGRKSPVGGNRESRTISLPPRIWKWLAVCAEGDRRGGVSGAVETVITYNPLYQLWQRGETDEEDRRHRP